MIAIVSGSRQVTDFNFIERVIKGNPHYHQITEIFEGGASGVDTCALDFAGQYKLGHTRFLADWYQHGLSAGPIRNREMLEHALKSGKQVILIAIPHGESRGTRNMIKQALSANVETFIYEYKDQTSEL